MPHAALIHHQVGHSVHALRALQPSRADLVIPHYVEAGCVEVAVAAWFAELTGVPALLRVVALPTGDGLDVGGTWAVVAGGAGCAVGQLFSLDVLTE